MHGLVYDIWLSLALTPDTNTFKRLLSVFQSSKSVFDADIKELKAALGADIRGGEKLLDKNLDRAEEVFDFCKSRGVGILTYFDERFPESLRNIPTPPVLLYYRGVLPDFDRMFCTAVVGTRSVSSYGRKNAYNIAYDLAKSGTTVVSGMALGIDGVALAGALSAGGVTVAVIGSGIDVCYPMQHKTLAREIVKRGCVFTEFAPGTRPERYNFPRRNRIISGLCAATVVIEGNERSGALLTARHAMKQGRTVYALPGNIGSKNSEVCNLLLKNGAKALTSADDVVLDFCDKYRGLINPFKLGLDARPRMEDELIKYAVSAVSPDDPIFITVPKKRIEKEKAPSQSIGLKVENQAEQKEAQKPASELTEEPEKHIDPIGFDAKTLKIYKKIPMNEPCLIESLVDSEFNLREVMKALLKLEMGRFVKMLPSERVARNL